VQEPGSFGWLLLKTTLLLVAICLLAYLVLRFLARRQLGRWGMRAGGPGRLAVVDRLALGPRASLQVVRAGSRVLLLGASEAGIQLLCELEPSDWGDGSGAPGGGFEALVARHAQAAAEPPPSPPEADT
jgi:flagellar biosynthetic protein FliO